MKKIGTVFLSTIAVTGVSLLLSACSSFGIRTPTHGQRIQDPATVKVEVAWTPANQMQNLKVILEHTNATPTATANDITSQFVVTATNATKTLSLPIGKYRVTATGEVYDSLYRRNISHSYPVKFEIYGTAGLTINAQPSIGLMPGASAAVTVAATREGTAVTTPSLIALTVDHLPSNVTATGGTIATNASSAAVTLTASTFAGHSANARINANSTSPSGAITDSTNLTVRVGRASANFALVPIQAANAGATAASPDGNTVLSIIANVPGYATAQVARFTRSGTPTVLMDLGFNMGQLLSLTNSYGGAGFCAASSAGFAISGVNANRGVVAGTDFVVFAGRLDDSSRQTARLEVWGVRPPPLGQAATYAFAPQVWFTPDCLVMMVLSSQSSQSGVDKHLATFYDFSNRSLICEKSFDQSPTAPGFSARVVAGQVNDTIELRADGQTKICSVQ